MSDERDGAGSPVAGTEPDVDGSDAADGRTSETAERGSSRGSTAVVARPQRPTGKRSRRAASDVEDALSETDSSEDDASTSGDAKKTKKPKKKTAKTGPSRNPFAFVWNYLKQVVAELRKVIWPNRKQMVSYTTVVLVFLTFMVALIGGVDLGLAKLVTLVFG